VSNSPRTRRSRSRRGTARAKSRVVSRLASSCIACRETTLAAASGSIPRPTHGGPLREGPLHPLPHERLRRRGIVGLAFVQLLGVVEERREELSLVGRGAQREARMGAGDVGPLPAHQIPERLRALAILPRGGIVEALEPLVAVEPDLLREHGLVGG